MRQLTSTKTRASGRRGRAGRALLLLIAAFLGIGHLRAARAADVTIYYHDPDVNLTQSQRFERKVTRLLDKIHPGIRFRVFPRLGLLRQALTREPPDFVMVPPYLARELGAVGDLQPLLIRQRRRSNFTEYIVIGTGTLQGLKGQTLAATGSVARPTVLDGLLLKGTGLHASELRTLQVKKDVDAVLAAGRGQVAAACVAKRSFDLVLRANPALGRKLKTMHTIRNVPLGALCKYKSPDVARVREVEEVFAKLHRSRRGKKLLRLLKADRLTKVDDVLRKRLIP